MKSPRTFTFFWMSIASISAPGLCVSTDSLTVSEPMRDGDTLISRGGTFQLGFFGTNYSGDRYLGIWFHNIPTRTIVWVANRDNPVKDSSGVVKIQKDGSLVIIDGAERLIWSSNTRNLSCSSTAAKLLDSGNLVLIEDDGNDFISEPYLWQSFDYPSDTILPGMRIGWDLRTNLDLHLTSWKSPEDPSSGDFTWGVDLRGIPQEFLRQGSVKKYRTGPLDQFQHSTDRSETPNQAVIPKIIDIPSEVYYVQHNETGITRAVLNYSGEYQRYVWNNGTLQWDIVHTFPSDLCDKYGNCGVNSLCSMSTFRPCSCLADYTPKSPQEWDMFLWTSGCVNMNPLNCSGQEGFKRLSGVKWPDLLQFKENSSMSLKECEAECLKNCSCTAYASMNANGKGNGCIHWFGDLVDIRLVNWKTRDLFIRVMASELGNPKKKIWMLALAIPFAMLICFWTIWKKRKADQAAKFEIHIGRETGTELHVFDMITMVKATDNFSFSNKIGEGGFGPVYKGWLPNGQPIAVKRLSENSRQGLDEFKNEVMFIAKLQHRNLVRLLGCCIEGEERILIYEYMSNGSLDSFIFGESTSNTLEWRRRFHIIVGVARGLLYLHRDSRLTIIHRDLKASNVLLDKEMNPKISDFGLARIYGGDLSLTKTKRIIGTYGYMSPEYAIDGLISVKSDVFSFGVLVLEIVSGRRNREFRHIDHAFNLLGHAWKLWGDDQALELVDEQLQDSFPESEVLRCIQIGLLCVQKHPKDRPTMSSVLMMLDSENSVLPQPKQPGFYSERSLDQNHGESNEGNHSANQISVSLEQGR